MKFIKILRWKLSQNRLEKDLQTYCSYEFRPADRGWAFEQVMSEHKNKFFGE